MNIVKYDRNIDAFVWRCMHKSRIQYKKYVSVRNGSFFEHFNLFNIEIFRILIRYGTRCPRYSIIEYFGVSKNTVLKIIRKLILLMPPPNFANNKLGGQGQIV